MEEPVVDVVETSKTTPERVFEKPESTPQVLEEPPKKRGGRPAGSKDKAPRRRKIVEEPIVTEPPKSEPTPAPKTEPERKPEPKAEPKPEPKPEPAPEPLSPGSLLRESARHMLELKRLNDSARKSHLQSIYTRRLAGF